MAKTYEAIATTTLGSAASSYTFSSIPSTYTDLILIIQATTISANFNMRFNSDTGSNYSYTSLWGDGSSAASYKSTNNTVMGLTYTSSGAPISKIQIQNYASSSVFKSVLIRQDDSTNATGAVMGLWRSTAAITSVTIVSGGNLPTGTSLTLYGIKAA
jgi:hypothetical protein